jgi:hypothetical protein
LERIRPLVIGSRLGHCNATLNSVRRALAPPGQAAHQSTVHQVTSEAEAAILRQPHEINLRIDNVITAVEAALLDLLGQFLGVPSRRCSAMASSASRSACWPICSTSPTARVPTCRITPTRGRKTAGCACATNRL